MNNHSPEYLAYLQSFTWHLKRHLRMIYAGHKCEICGSRKGLECHHRTYIRLYRERISDLQILCEDCHPLEDEKRRREKAIETFGLKKYGPPWITIKERVASEFDEWLKNKT